MPTTNKGFGLLFEMGCGKTLTAIAVTGAAYQMGKVERVLIVAPTSVCAVWPKEFSDYAAFPYTIKTMLGDKRKRLKELDDLVKFPYPHLKVAVINYESTWRDGIYEALENYDADLIICDESQRIKTHDSEQSKAMHRLGDKARYKMILSGTPVQNEAVDIFSQYRFLDSTIFGQNFYVFRNRYAVMGGFNRKQIVAYRDLDQLIQKEHSIAYRVTKEEALDLPEQTFENRYITMNAKERNLYDRLRRDSFAELSDGGTITATTVLTKLLRLQQFTGGFLVEDDATKPQLVSTGKLDALSDILQDYVVEGKKKLVIFARFLPEVHEIEKLAEKVVGKHGMRTVAIYGEIKKEDRGSIVQQFQTDPATMVFIGQIDTAGTGITLTAADTCVFYSVNFNYATYSQSLCPFHRDRNNSFSVDLRTGKWHCFSEDEGGNFVSFWAKLHGVDTKQAYKEILAKYGVSGERPEPAKKKPSGSGLPPYSLEQYSDEKMLPLDFLKDVCRASTGKERDGTTYLKLPYLKEDSQQATYRRRYGKKEFRWAYGASGKICLYGEWRLHEFRQQGWAVLVEGESDTQSLWYMGIPAIGVAGASMFKPEQAAVLQGLTLYIHKEPDNGGDTFISKVCRGLYDGGFAGDVYIWACSTLGTKDPSDLYMKYGRDRAAEKIRKAMSGLEPVNIAQLLTPEVIPGAPINLRTPEGWIYSDKGISAIDQKTYVPANVCRTPIILTQRLKSLETGDEKMEIAFKRDDQWHTAIYPRSTIFSSRSITALADLGCTITSENAKQVVKFLGALEAENIDLIPRNDATGTFGWQPGKRFLPGRANGITLDIDPSQRGMAAAYCQNGTMERWIEHMKPHRERDKFRFILAASFAAPLLRIVKQRIFFVYNWGGSKGGKTAALKAALSAWGDPERLMVNFNATQVGLERTAAFYCDLPLGIDERQLAGNNQGALEKIVYMIASGTGKIRGAKGGGLQTIHQWRTIALATGEEPLSTDTSQTGVSTRVLEIYGGPFDNEQDAAMMHQQSATDCGWAGPAFIDKILELDELQIVDAYERMQQYVREVSEGKNGSHIAGISAVALADAMIDTWFFGGKPESSWERAKRMASNILINQVESNATDVNENAVQFIVDWVLSNKAYFGPHTVGTCLGFTSETGNTTYIYPSMLNQALSKAGYSPRKTMKYMAEKGLISTDVDKTNKKQYSVIKWFGNRSARFVEFHIGKLSESKDPIDDYDEINRSNDDLPDGWAKMQFAELPDDGQEELPF